MGTLTGVHQLRGVEMQDRFFAGSEVFVVVINDDLYSSLPFDALFRTPMVAHERAQYFNRRARSMGFTGRANIVVRVRRKIEA